MSISNELHRIWSELPVSAKLVAVSKFHPVEAVREAYDAGQRIFGESRVQEVCQKVPILPNDIEWHFIGHLQTNKVRQIVPIVHLIHSVDSLKLLLEINKEGERIRRSVPVLLQVHIALEEAKFGFSFEECQQLFQSGTLKDFPFVKVRGLMGMATLTDDKARIRSEFQSLHTFFDTIQKKYTTDFPLFTELSMGMSDDYQLAIESGSTMVRIGSRIFGQRQY
jgi:PLP dependent protein